MGPTATKRLGNSNGTQANTVSTRAEPSNTITLTHWAYPRQALKELGLSTSTRARAQEGDPV